MYLFDQPLATQCPQGIQTISEPSFVSGNYLAKTSSSSLWPSLFVGHSEVHSELHVDAWCSHFYMRMLHGRKRWTIFPQKQAHLLRKNHASARYALRLSDFLHSKTHLPSSDKHWHVYGRL
eukprot:TRINITY_DN12491_c1_g1_i17.p3 TRINITY_DN12491_c1_g1~~TRINITY_DN12491_c1_g1_i17.p3  ORF type:complete len:121 (+),score=11.46 TRINITY_DN12491_c1_g1_i17:671-1033(+)